jgi:hypothetical protein
LENVDIFYGHLEYSTAIWYNVWPFGIICGHWGYFSRFGMFGRTKIRQPCIAQQIAYVAVCTYNAQFLNHRANACSCSIRRIQESLDL